MRLKRIIPPYSKPYPMKFNRTLSVCLVLSFLPLLSFGQEARIFSNEFLSIGLGARAQGMANSYVATTNDVYSIFWNPAGLAEVEEDIQIGYKHAEYFAGIANYDFGGVAFKGKDSSSLAFGVVRFGVDDIANTLYLVEPDGTVDYDNITLFSVADYAFFGSYGKQMGRFSLGGSAKIIHRRVGPFATAWGFGLDFGAKYRISSRFMLAALARDVTSTFNAWSITMTEEDREALAATGNELPENSIEITLPKLLLGVNYIQPLGTNMFLRSELGIDLFFDGQRNALISSELATIDPHIGLEFGFKNIFFVRAGVGNFQDEETFDPRQTGQVTTFQPNVGAGLKLKYVSIDYAFTDLTNSSVAPYSHLISMRFDLNKDLFAKNLANEAEEDPAE